MIIVNNFYNYRTITQLINTNNNSKNSKKVNNIYNQPLPRFKFIKLPK